MFFTAFLTYQCEHAFPALHPLCMLWQLVLPKPSKIWPSGNSSLCDRWVYNEINIFSFTFFCQLDVKSQLTGLPHSIWSNIVVEKYKYLLAPLQVFVSQLQMSHGPVPKSGLKLLQMFSNDRLQCQHKPTSTFVYYIFLFDVVQMNLTASQTHSGARWESTSR